MSLVYLTLPILCTLLIVFKNNYVYLPTHNVIISKEIILTPTTETPQ